MEVLYIEDVPVISNLHLAMAAASFKDRPIKIIHVADYAAAIAYLKDPANRPNMIVSDFEFPGKPTGEIRADGTEKFTTGGIEIYADALADYPTLPFVFVTAAELPDLHNRLKERNLTIDAKQIVRKNPFALVSAIKLICENFTPIMPGPPDSGSVWAPYPEPS